jgi:mRNA-degrading endonuclease RelE of RelBE toxin-antitoxin system
VAYRIQLTKSAEEHFADLTARQQAIVLNAIKVQLRHEPTRETRNRKPLRPNPLAPWELRIGFLRVFYEVDALGSDLVNILAIGIKKGNQLFVSGKGIHL